MTRLLTWPMIAIGIYLIAAMDREPTVERALVTVAYLLVVGIFTLAYVRRQRKQERVS